MKPMRIVRENPFATHISTSKFKKPLVNKKLKNKYIKKVDAVTHQNSFQHSRIGRKRRYYYHDHRYDDPWSDDATIRYSRLPYRYKSRIHDNADYRRHMADFINELRILAYIRNQTTSPAPTYIGFKYLQTKIIFRYKIKRKLSQIQCLNETILSAIFDSLHS